MSQPDSRMPKDNRSRNNSSDPNFNWRGLVLFAIAIALIGGALLFRGPYGNVEDIPYYKFAQLLEGGQIRKDRPLELIVEEGRSTQSLKGFYQPTKAGTEEQPVPFRTAVFVDFNHDLQDKL